MAPTLRSTFIPNGLAGTSLGKLNAVLLAVTHSAGRLPAARDQAADIADVTYVLDLLVESGWVEDAGADLPGSLSAHEAERYSRRLQFLSWVDTTPRSGPYEHQAKLKASRVTILGAGGTGTAVAASLAALRPGMPWTTSSYTGPTLRVGTLFRA